MTEDECIDLYKQAQDLAYNAITLDGLYRELDCNSEHDELAATIGKEVYELVRRRIDEKRDELEAQAVSGEVARCSE